MKKIGRFFSWVLLIVSAPFTFVGIAMYFKDHDSTNLGIAGFFGVILIIAIVLMMKTRTSKPEINLNGVPADGIESQLQNTPIQTVQQPKTPRGAIVCPNCGSANIQLWDGDANYKSKKIKTSINLNPLHPFTVFNSKEVKKEKKSKGKVALAVMTGGASALVTGTTDKRHKELFCTNCGNHWFAK